MLSLDRTASPPLLNVFGGKITTYRRLAEGALRELAAYFPEAGPAWTAGVALPGGDFPVDGVADLIAELQARYPFLDVRWARRLVRAYGTEAQEMLGDAVAPEDLGVAFGATLTEREVDWLRAHEFALTAEDVVWRRSKLGLRLGPEQIATLDHWMAGRGVDAAPVQEKKRRGEERMALSLQGVTKVVDGRPHIQPTTLSLEKGTMNVLLGPTLAGKTSLMRLMAGLDAPSAGRILWHGADVTGKRVQDRDIAMVYQQFINYPSFTVYENIASPLRLLRRPKAEIDAAVRKTAELLKLTPMLTRRPLELSGGQQQRCALARALVKGAGLVLLDEPLGNLDYKLREELRAEIPRIFEESGAIFVYATTEPEEALLLGGQTATLWEGRVTQFGPTPTVYRQPIDATTARVFSSPPMNFLQISKTGNRLMFGRGQSVSADGPHERLPDGSYLAGFRPHHLGLDPRGARMLALTVTVTMTEFTGAETFVHMACGSDRWVGLGSGTRDLPIGSEQQAYLDPAHVYIFGEDGRLVAPAAYAQAA